MPTRRASIRRSAIGVARPGHFALRSRAARRLFRLSLRTNSHRSVSLLTGPDHRGLWKAARGFNRLFLSLGVGHFNFAGQRELAGGTYNLRRSETHDAARAFGVRALRDLSSAQITDRRDIPDLLRRRARHVVEENERVWRAVELLESGNGRGFGKLMNDSHESSRRNFENSTPELDLLVSIAQRSPGVLGARLTGAGFGGATVTLSERSAAPAVARQLAKDYATQTGTEPEVFVCEIADGAC